jgi:hypothetical protein
MGVDTLTVSRCVRPGTGCQEFIPHTLEEDESLRRCVSGIDNCAESCVKYYFVERTNFFITH